MHNTSVTAAALISNKGVLPSELNLGPSFLHRTRPNDSNSSNASSLTRENVEQHNALLASHDHIVDLSNSLNFEVNDSMPSQNIGSTPSSSRELESSTLTETLPSPVESTDIEASPRPCHVHFRPRVRITSGINRHRHTTAVLAELDRALNLTPTSSRSSSPCSSISAPLHSRTDDEADKPGWGPLGRRVALLSRQSRRRIGRDRRRKKELDEPLPPTERTPLLRPRVQSPTIDSCGHSVYDMFESDPEEGAPISRAREIDAVFGTMPRRLLNHHWWWWQLEPLICCRCLDESDTE